jgi:hypothetical protein
VLVEGVKHSLAHVVFEEYVQVIALLDETLPVPPAPVLHNSIQFNSIENSIQFN